MAVGVALLLIEDLLARRDDTRRQLLGGNAGGGRRAVWHKTAPFLRLRGGHAKAFRGYK